MGLRAKSGSSEESQTFIIEQNFLLAYSVGYLSHNLVRFEKGLAKEEPLVAYLVFLVVVAAAYCPPYLTSRTMPSLPNCFSAAIVSSSPGSSQLLWNA